MAKAAEAFRTISEVADELDIPKHVLRFWEGKFSHVRPMKRGGGRRYYRPEDLELLKGIKQLLHGQGFTIRGVQKILREHGAEQVKLLANARGTTVVAAGEEGVKQPDSPRRSKQAARTAPPQATPLSQTARLQIAAVIHELSAIRDSMRDPGSGLAEIGRAKQARTA